MRFKGTIAEWNDSRGFGFIEPTGDGERGSRGLRSEWQRGGLRAERRGQRHLLARVRAAQRLQGELAQLHQAGTWSRSRTSRWIMKFAACAMCSRC